MKQISDKLIKKGFNIGSECYIFFNGKIVKAKIVDGDVLNTFFTNGDEITPFVDMKVLPVDIPKLNGWSPEICVNTNKLYKTYEEAEKNRKKIISVNDFLEGDDNVHKENIIARIKVKTPREYKKLKEYIDETYIINDNEEHIYDNISDFPCVVIVIENNKNDILIIQKENIIKTFENFNN